MGNGDAGMNVPTEMKNWRGQALKTGGAIGGGVSEPATSLPPNEVTGKSGYLRSAPGAAQPLKPTKPSGAQSTGGLASSASPDVLDDDSTNADEERQDQEQD